MVQNVDTPNPLCIKPGYLDYAATAPILPVALAALCEGYRYYGNPSSVHSLGEEALEQLKSAREQCASLLGFPSKGTVFTSGGTESINWVLQATAAKHNYRGTIVSSEIEHSAVLETLKYLSTRGIKVAYVAPSAQGVIAPEDIYTALTEDTILVCVMHANNETGVLQPVDTIADFLEKKSIPILIDSVQTAGKLVLVNHPNAYLPVSAHKFGGPRGVGMLKLAESTRLSPLIFGGGQEHYHRAGTENLPGILSMLAALQECCGKELVEQEKSSKIREIFIREFRSVPGFTLTTIAPGVNTIISCRFTGVRGDTLRDALDMKGICVSTGSACNSSKNYASQVLSSMGLEENSIQSTIRISFSSKMEPGDAETVSKIISETVRHLQKVAGSATAQ